MNRYRSILLCVLWIAAALPAFAAHYPITTAQISAALAASGLQFAANQVEPLADVVATVAQPALTIKSVEPTAGHLLVARMECADSRQCLPFLVALHLNGDNSGFLSTVALHGGLGQASSQPPVYLVRVGSPATLLLDGDHVHISLTVICLENGALGQIVRAANPDRRQFYRVRVVGKGILRGNL